jgi:hypothetical protein
MNFRKAIKTGFCLLLPLVMTFAIGGCSSANSNQIRDAYQAGYRAGQQDARMQSQTPGQPQPSPTQALPQTPAPSQQSVIIVGPVRNPIIPWRLGLSLAQAIISAGYSGETDPSEILIVRSGTARRIDFSKLLAGEDVPLMPGDTVQIK